MFAVLLLALPTSLLLAPSISATSEGENQDEETCSEYFESLSIWRGTLTDSGHMGKWITHRSPTGVLPETAIRHNPSLDWDLDGFNNSVDFFPTDITRATMPHCGNPLETLPRSPTKYFDVDEKMTPGIFSSPDVDALQVVDWDQDGDMDIIAGGSGVPTEDGNDLNGDWGSIIVIENGASGNLDWLNIHNIKNIPGYASPHDCTFCTVPEHPGDVDEFALVPPSDEYQKLGLMVGTHGQIRYYEPHDLHPWGSPENELVLQAKNWNPWTGDDSTDYSQHARDLIIADTNNDGFPEMAASFRHPMTYEDGRCPRTEYFNEALLVSSRLELGGQYIRECQRIDHLNWYDVNLDGMLDLIICDKECYSVTNLGTSLDTVNGYGLSSDWWIDGHGIRKMSSAMADYNQDGFYDLAVGGADGYISIYLGSSTGLSSTATQRLSNEYDARYLHWADMDGNGYLDLIVGNDGKDRIYQATDEGNHLELAWESIHRYKTNYLMTADVDLDGDLDLIGSNLGQIFIIHNEVDPDSDGDGVIDSADKCPNSSPNLCFNSTLGNPAFLIFLLLSTFVVWLVPSFMTGTDPLNNKYTVWIFASISLDGLFLTMTGFSINFGDGWWLAGGWFEGILGTLILISGSIMTFKSKVQHALGGGGQSRAKTFLKAKRKYSDNEVARAKKIVHNAWKKHNPDANWLWDFSNSTYLEYLKTAVKAYSYGIHHEDVVLMYKNGDGGKQGMLITPGEFFERPFASTYKHEFSEWKIVSHSFDELVLKSSGVKWDNLPYVKNTSNNIFIHEIFSTLKRAHLIHVRQPTTDICMGITQSGNRCKNQSAKDSNYCGAHRCQHTDRFGRCSEGRNYPSLFCDLHDPTQPPIQQQKQQIPWKSQGSQQYQQPQPTPSPSFKVYTSRSELLPLSNKELNEEIEKRKLRKSRDKEKKIWSILEEDFSDTEYIQLLSDTAKKAGENPTKWIDILTLPNGALHHFLRNNSQMNAFDIRTGIILLRRLVAELESLSDTELRQVTIAFGIPSLGGGPDQIISLVEKISSFKKEHLMKMLRAMSLPTSGTKKVQITQIISALDWPKQQSPPVNPVNASPQPSVVVDSSGVSTSLLEVDSPDPEVSPTNVSSQGQTSDERDGMKELAFGGMKKIFLRTEPNGTQVVYKEASAHGEQMTLTIVNERLDFEAELLKEIGNHPRIPELIEHSHIDLKGVGKVSYLVEEFIAGPTLEQLLKDISKRNIHIEIDTIVEWVIDLCEPLISCGNLPDPVYHRDLKPGNIIVHETRGPIIIDWGVAKIVTSSDDTTSQIFHSQAWTPPERRVGISGSFTDVYSLGKIMACLLLREENPPTVVDDEDLKTFIKAGASDELAQIIVDACKPRSERRIASVLDLHNRLIKLGSATPIVVSKPVRGSPEFDALVAAKLQEDAKYSRSVESTSPNLKLTMDELGDLILSDQENFIQKFTGKTFIVQGMVSIIDEEDGDYIALENEHSYGGSATFWFDDLYQQSDTKSKKIALRCQERDMITISGRFDDEDAEIDEYGWNLNFEDCLILESPYGGAQTPAKEPPESSSIANLFRTYEKQN